MISSVSERPNGDDRRALLTPATEGLGVALEAPTVGGSDGVAHGYPTWPVAIQVAVLQFDEGAATLVRERDVNLAGFGAVCLDLPGHADIPAESDVSRRLIDQDRRPAALAAVDAAVQ